MIGAALVLVVGFVRNVLLAKVPWFQTKPGGYILGWGFTTIAYIGTALEQRATINLHLFEMAFAAGLLASGVLDHYRDLLGILTPPPRTGAFDPKTGQTDMAKSAGVSLLVLAVLIGLTVSCATVKAVPGAAKTAAVECIKQDAKPILAVVAQLGVQAALSVMKLGDIDWEALEKLAYEQGETTGGCALTRFVAELEKTTKPDTAVRSLVAAPDPVNEGRAAVKRLSARFGGTTWVQ